MTASIAGRDSLLVALAALEHQAERFRADSIRRSAQELAARLERSVSLFQEAMNRHLDETIQAIEGALASAIERRQATAAETDARLSALIVGMQELEQLAAQVDQTGRRAENHDGRQKRLERYLMVMAGGAVGSLARYAAASAVMNRFGGRFPLGTMAVNVTGSFLIGLLMALLTERFQADPTWRLLLVVGFLGGYTTFSSLEYETYRTVRDGGPWMGLFNAVGSIVLGYLAVWLGSSIATRS